jgi:hypothetical protein
VRWRNEIVAVRRKSICSSFPRLERKHLFAATCRVGSGLRSLAFLGFAFALSACQQQEARWPLTCAPGESIGFRPDSGDHSTWRQWNWAAGRTFVLARAGEAPNFAYRIETTDVGWSDAACAAEADGKHVVCDSGERRMRLSVDTLHFAVASEAGYRDESNNPTFDRADIALGVCRGGGS